MSESLISQKLYVIKKNWFQGTKFNMADASSI
jgi:hypothetical protein